MPDTLPPGHVRAGDLTAEHINKVIQWRGLYGILGAARPVDDATVQILVHRPEGPLIGEVPRGQPLRLI